MYILSCPDGLYTIKNVNFVAILKKYINFCIKWTGNQAEPREKKCKFTKINREI